MFSPDDPNAGEKDFKNALSSYMGQDIGEDKKIQTPVSKAVLE
jgi:hypothetical protein